MRCIRGPCLATFVAISAILASGVPEASAANAAIAAGTQHSVALKSDGSVVTWGADPAGQLGVGRVLSSSTAIQVAGLPGAKSVSSGWNHLAILSTNGHVVSWGANGDGQLGTGASATSYLSPAISTPAAAMGLPEIASIAGGSTHTLALATDGTVWAWGSASNGEIGDGRPEPNLLLGQLPTRQPTPIRVPGLGGIVAVGAGQYMSVAVTSNGTLMSWGRGFHGDGASTVRVSPAPVAGVTGVKAVSTDAHETVALKADGTVLRWSNAFKSPSVVPGIADAVSVSTGYSHSVVVRRDGSVWAWGQNLAGQVGPLGSGSDGVTPVRVTGISGVVAASAGGDFTVALKSDGSVWMWGSGTFAPSQVAGIAGATALSAGYAQAMALRSDGTVWVWGDNRFGQLANGTVLSRPVPSVVAGLGSITDIGAGYAHTLAVKSDGTVWAWGLNDWGQLGDGTKVPRNRPQQVPGVAGATAVAAGRDFSLALKTDGTVWGWGSNGSRQLGGEDYASVVVPRPIPGLAGVTAIAAAGSYGLALKNDGTVWAWGQHPMVIGTSTGVTQVPGLANVAAISAGDAHALALRGNGSVWGWGLDAFGELGGTQEPNNPQPAAIGGLNYVIAIAAGTFTSYAVKRDGTVWALGANFYGQLGGATSARNAGLTNIPGLDDIVAVSASGSSYGYHAIALRADGTLWAWGANFSGQVGDGTYAIPGRPSVVRREQGEGEIATDDWYLDLQPGVKAAIPAESIPAFLVLATSPSERVTVTASVRFRAQDVGRPYRIYAYAPVALVSKSLQAKDSGCVLSQLSGSGLVAVSGTTLEAAGNVTGALNQAVTLLSNVATSQTAGATFCIGTGTGEQAISAANRACAVTVPAGSSAVTCLPQADLAVSANVPGALSGLWWNAAESGWGVHFTQRRDIVFAAWYAYDGAGGPKWYVASDCRMAGGATATTGTCSGALYEVSGPAFFGAAFNPAAVKVVAAGNLQVAFQGAANATMMYSVGSLTRTVAITRQPIAAGTVPGVDYTDLWWNASESGWGLAIAQQASTLFLAWYVYDGTGKPVWYVASSCVLSGTGCTGTLYRTTGPPLGPSFNPAQVQVISAGTITVSFTDGNNGVISYTVNGVSGSKAITRQVF